MTTSFNISRSVDQAIVTELEDDFDSFRGRIAGLSVDACSMITDLYAPEPVVAEILHADEILELGTGPDRGQLALVSSTDAAKKADSIILQFATS